MSFDTRDLRRGMDVYTLDGVYLGSVLRVMRRAGPRGRDAGAEIEPAALRGPARAGALTRGPHTDSPRTWRAARSPLDRPADRERERADPGGQARLADARGGHAVGGEPGGVGAGGGSARGSAAPTRSIPNRNERSGPEPVAAERFHGEALGPVPTAALGNSGPSGQTAATDYASRPAGEAARTQTAPASELLVFRWLVALDPATLRPVLRRIPVSLVQTVTLERVVLAVSAAELDAASRAAPPR